MLAPSYYTGGLGALSGRRFSPLQAPDGSTLDQVDLHILRRLHGDARTQNQSLASEVELSPSACLARQRRLETGGVIQRYSIEVNDAVFASWSVLWIQVRLRRGSEVTRATFEAAITAAPEVLEAHELVGVFDYLLKAALPNMAAWSGLRVRIDPGSALIKRAEVLASVRAAKRASPHPLLLRA